MLLMGSLVLAMFVGISMAKNQQNGLQKGDCDRVMDCDYDCFCGWLFDMYEEGICDFCGGYIPEDVGGNGPYGPNDTDGDGIPNCDDPDYIPPQNGTGYQFGRK